MNKDEKMTIEEMAKVITDLEDCEYNVCFIDCRLDCYCADCEYDSKEKKGICGCVEYAIAEHIYNAGYRKVGDDEIVVKKSEYEMLSRDYLRTYDYAYREGVADGERELAKTIISVIWEEEKDETIRIKDVHDTVREIAEKHGIELE